MKKTCVIILLILFVSVCYARQNQHIRILTQTTSYTDIEITIDSKHSIRYTKQGKQYSWFDYDYCLPVTDSSRDIIDFYTRIPLVIPTKQTNVQILSTESSIFDNIVPPKASLLGIPEEQWLHKGEATLTDFQEMNNCLFASLDIRVVEYLGAGKVKVLSKIVLRISYSTPYPQTISPLALTDWRQAVLLNRPESKLKKTQAQSSVLAEGVWYRIPIQEEGVYKLDRSFFTKHNIPSSFWSKIREVRIYGNGGMAVPQNPTILYPLDLEEIARLVVDQNGNGEFDEGDYILFYAQSMRGWRYLTSAKNIQHYIHPYSETNYYFITSKSGQSGKDMQSITALDGYGDFKPAFFRNGVFIEQEKYNLIKSGRRWVGQRFDGNNTSVTYTNLLPGLVASQPIEYRFLFCARSSTADNITITENGESLISTRLPSMYISASDNVGRYCEIRDVSVKTIRSLPDNRSILKIQYTPSNTNALAWLDWMEIIYFQKYEAVNDYLSWWWYDTTAIVEYEINKLSSRNVYVFDISDHANAKTITNLQYDPADPTVCRFVLPHIESVVQRFAIVGSNGTKIPSPPELVENSNLHGVNVPVDYIIITPKEFSEQANRLKTYRETNDTLRVFVATIQSIYNEFSGGIQDPFAIRNFLKYAREYWVRTPRYVLFFGSGHYDYKNITTTLRNWIPPFETDESNFQIQSYCSDDSLVILQHGSDRVSMALGRIPVRTINEAKIAVDKIIRYERESPFDEWRNRITLLADDEFATRVVGDSASLPKEYMHAQDTELLARSYTPKTMMKQKIFLSQYPDVITASGRRKPRATEALLNTVNNGTLILNYIGHGNESVWAHEEVFSQASILPQFTNYKKLFVLIAATCDFALYDDPSIVSGGEEIITMSQGGGIVGISAARPVYANQNIALTKEIFRQLFLQDSLGYAPRIGDVMWTVKQSYYSVNDKKYHLFGDPAIRILLPRHRASIDSVNDQPASITVAVKALGKVTTIGSIRTQSLRPLNDFAGEGILKIYGPTQVIRFNNWPATDSFLINGSLLYSGKVSVTNGVFRAQSRIPKDVLFGNKSQITFYGYGASADAVGMTENIVITDIDTTAMTDDRGPEIRIFFDNLSFRSGDVVPPTTTMIVRLADENGINTSVLGIGHGLTAVLSRPQQEIDLSTYYQSDLDTYQSGEARYELRNLPFGKNSVRVKAWDIHNNSSEAEVFFEVVQDSPFEIMHVYNYPNPFKSTTSFMFQRPNETPISVEIKIFTIAGRMIKKIVVPYVTDRFVQISWDGSDATGHSIANGVYLYKVIAKNLDTHESKEYIGKLVRIQ